ncbi:protein kinase family protein [Tundrisphaera sp. TA3]|uniref:protein kinase family protein n=1 Tax=Tundrisphaera sp. TA3 TaxID=3435775 RepID=UPI003EB79026
MQPSLADCRYAAMHEGDRPIPGYRLIRRRGRGGFGEVWEAEAPGGFLVALKFVHLSARARAAELRALDFVRGIHHPNLLANFGSWQVDDTLIIGMELADRSLWDRQQEANHRGLLGIPRGELLAYMAGAAAGIDHLNDYRHTIDGRGGYGVQHRDLKPSNILLFGGGAKVADLGMARAMDREVAGHTGIWTFAYAPPEFFRGETSRQSDQYSLAVTYCQLRGGRLPFDGGAASVTAGHLFGDPDLGGLPGPERAVVGRALSKAPGDRWPGCRAFVEALLAISPDAVPDVLLDPGGSIDDPASADVAAMAGASCLDSWDLPPVDWTSGSAWGRGVSGPDSGRDPLPFTGSSPDDFEASLSGPGTHPTLVLPTIPAVEAGPESSPAAPPGPRRRPRRAGRLAAAAAATIALAGARAHCPTLDPAPPVAREADPVPELAIHPAAPGLAVPPPAFDAEIALEGPIAMGVSRPGTLPPLPMTPPGPAAPVGTASVVLASIARPSTPAPSPAPDASPAEASYARGRALVEGRSYAGAIAAFDEAIRLDPGHVASVFGRAIARHRSGDLRAAVADYGEVIRARPGAIPTYSWRGRAYDALGDHERAIADFGEVIRARPGDADARFLRGLSRYKSGDFARSIGDLTETLQIDPKHARAFALRDEALARLAASEAAARTPQAPPASPPAAPPRSAPAPVGPGVRLAGTAPAPAPAASPAGVVREASYRAAPDPSPPGAVRPSGGPPRQAAPGPAARPTPRIPARKVVPWPFAGRVQVR